MFFLYFYFFSKRQDSYNAFKLKLYHFEISWHLTNSSLRDMEMVPKH